MTREEVKNWLNKLYARADITDEYGDMEDMQPYEEALDMAIQALEQELCDDAISRQAALDTFGLSEKSRKYGGDHSGYDTIMLYEVQDGLEALPSVQPQSKTGHWIGTENEEMETIGYYCSECDLPMETENQTRFCPNCGAKMIQESEG